MQKVGLLGPKGTYSHEVAEKRWRGQPVEFVFLNSIKAVCDWVSGSPSRLGMVPITNSSGGALYETVDALLAEDSKLLVYEEMRLQVRLALLGHQRKGIDRIYSHFVPLAHCEKWLKKNFSKTEKIACASTSQAAEAVVDDPRAAALASRRAGSLFSLKVLEYPITTDPAENITHFYCIGQKVPKMDRHARTALAIWLPNRPGSLVDFLKPISDARLNLSQLISRPLKGKPSEFSFFVVIDTSMHSKSFKDLLKQIKPHLLKFRVLGSFPAHRRYLS